MSIQVPETLVNSSIESSSIWFCGNYKRIIRELRDHINKANYTIDQYRSVRNVTAEHAGGKSSAVNTDLIKNLPAKMHLDWANSGKKVHQLLGQLEELIHAQRKIIYQKESNFEKSLSNNNPGLACSTANSSPAQSSTNFNNTNNNNNGVQFTENFVIFKNYMHSHHIYWIINIIRYHFKVGEVSSFPDSEYFDSLFFILDCFYSAINFIK